MPYPFTEFTSQHVWIIKKMEDAISRDNTDPSQNFQSYTAA